MTIMSDIQLLDLMLTTNEIIFQKADSYGAKTVDTIAKTTVPAHRGFAVGRFLTTELRWNCSCQDFSRRDSYDLFKRSNRIMKSFLLLQFEIQSQEI